MRTAISPSGPDEITPPRPWAGPVVRVQASTSSKTPGELLAMNVITFCRQARLIWQGWQPQSWAWGGPSRLASISKLFSLLLFSVPVLPPAP